MRDSLQDCDDWSNRTPHSSAPIDNAPWSSQSHQCNTAHITHSPACKHVLGKTTCTWGKRKGGVPGILGEDLATFYHLLLTKNFNRNRPNLATLFLKIYWYVLCVCVCVLECMYMNHLYAEPMEVRRGRWSPWVCSCRSLWVPDMGAESWIQVLSKSNKSS